MNIEGGYQNEVVAAGLPNIGTRDCVECIFSDTDIMSDLLK